MMSAKGADVQEVKSPGRLDFQEAAFPAPKSLGKPRTQRGLNDWNRVSLRLRLKGSF